MEDLSDGTSRVKYNLNGLAKEIQGKVISIFAASTNYDYHADGTACYHTTYKTNKNGPYMVIDGSGTFDGKTASVYLCDLLDCDMIFAWKENFNIYTVPKDPERLVGSVNALRTLDGVLQYTPDNGETWINVKVATTTDGEDDGFIAASPKRGSKKSS